MRRRVRKLVRRLLTRKLYRGEFIVDVSGLIAHGLLGFVAGAVGGSFLVVVALSYLFYQFLDFVSGESAREVQGDVVEFLIGVFIGVMFIRFGMV